MNDFREDDGPGWEQQEQMDRPLIEFMDAVDTVALFIGGEEGRRIRRALLAMANLPEPVSPEQGRINFDMTASLPF